MAIFNVQLAPFSVPLERRLQTLAVLLYTMLFTVTPFLVVGLFFFLLFSPFFLIPITYASWIFYDNSIRKSSSRGGGGRRWEALRSHSCWRYFRDFFPVDLHKSADLPAEDNYLFGYHPHGIMGCGAFANFATDITGFSKLFPGIRPHLMTLKPNFRYPLIRGFLLWMGVCDVSRESIEWILSKQGTGNAVIIVVGGAEEALEANPGRYNLTLKNRKGFIKMAIKSGAALVPVFSFGENDLFSQANNPSGSNLRRFQEFLKHIFGISPPLFHGRGIFNYTFGLVPYRKPVHTVVGKPIKVKQCDSPEQAQIDETHRQYMEALSELFDAHKTKFGVDADRVLHFV